MRWTSGSARPSARSRARSSPDGIRTGRQAQAALLLAATGALRPIQERFK